MEYHELRITFPDEAKEPLIAKLCSLGCIGVSEENGFAAYFEGSQDRTLLEERVSSFLHTLETSGLGNSFSLRYSHLVSKDWNEAWKKAIRPIEVGRNLVIIPPWERSTTERMPLIIDPGMAFGTGHHETTRRCLMLIEQYAGSAGEKTFLDIGTGTGILAIAAALLGFKSVRGIDNDPLAIEAAERNSALNSTKISIRQGILNEVEGIFDMIAANLISELLITIAADIKAHLRSSGIAILSGMLAGQDEPVIAAMRNQSLRLVERSQDGTWVSLVFKNA